MLQKLPLDGFSLVAQDGASVHLILTTAEDPELAVGGTGMVKDRESETGKWRMRVSGEREVRYSGELQRGKGRDSKRWRRGSGRWWLMQYERRDREER